jgi:hypothetical protein
MHGWPGGTRTRAILISSEAAKASRAFNGGNLVATVDDSTVQVRFEETGPDPTSETIIDKESDGGGAGNWITEEVCPWHDGDNDYKVTIKYKKGEKAGGGEKWYIKDGYPKATVWNNGGGTTSSSTVTSSTGAPETGMVVTISATFLQVPDDLPIDNDFVYARNVVLHGDFYGAAPESEEVDPADYEVTIDDVDIFPDVGDTLRYEVVFTVALDGLGSGRPDAIAATLQMLAFPTGEDPYLVAMQPTTIFDTDPQ